MLHHLFAALSLLAIALAHPSPHAPRTDHDDVKITLNVPAHTRLVLHDDESHVQALIGPVPVEFLWQLEWLESVTLPGTAYKGFYWDLFKVPGESYDVLWHLTCAVYIPTDYRGWVSFDMDPVAGGVTVLGDPVPFDPDSLGIACPKAQCVASRPQDCEGVHIPSFGSVPIDLYK
ncbi:hypothetical protein IAU60_001061 [Kwoniella sp. DSM 27419]